MSKDDLTDLRLNRLFIFNKIKYSKITNKKGITTFYKFVCNTEIILLLSLLIVKRAMKRRVNKTELYRDPRTLKMGEVTFIE